MILCRCSQPLSFSWLTLSSFFSLPIRVKDLPCCHVGAMLFHFGWVAQATTVVPLCLRLLLYGHLQRLPLACACSIRFVIFVLMIAFATIGHGAGRQVWRG